MSIKETSTNVTINYSCNFSYENLNSFLLIFTFFTLTDYSIMQS